MMPTPDVQTIASMRYIFAAIHDRASRGGCGVYDATGARPYMPVTNLGWLNRHSEDVLDLWVSTGQYRSLAIGGGPPYGQMPYSGFAAMLAARLADGRVYVTTFADADVLHEWLARPKWAGRTVHWDCHAYITGDRDYERLAWLRRKRRERERAYASEHGLHNPPLSLAAMRDGRA